MSQAISFPSTTANFDLPLLLSGQAQKEFFLNQSLAIVDAVSTGTVVSTTAMPPSDAEEGQCFLIASGATGDWTGRSGQLAIRIAGSWHFVDPVEGMEVYDQSAQQKRIFKTQWSQVSQPVEAQGGSVVDVEARALLGELISALRSLGIFAEPS